jgi:hypothetical protein
MSRQYSSKDFFRQVPNALLGRCYFHAQGLLSELNFVAMPEAKPEPLVEPGPRCRTRSARGAEADFREIWGISDRKGFLAIAWTRRAGS